MIELYLRPTYQRLMVDPIVSLLSRFSFMSANWITFVSLLFGLLAAAFIVLDAKYAVLFILFSGYCDTLDGSFSRATGTSSEVGAALDIMADRVVEVAIIFAFLSLDPIRYAWPVTAMLGTVMLCVTSFLLVGMFSKEESHKSFYYSIGIMERPEAFAFFITMIIFPSHFIMLAWVFSALVLLTAVTRILGFVTTADDCRTQCTAAKNDHEDAKR